MTNPQQQFAELSQANLEKTIRLTNIAITGAEKLFNLQLEIARDMLAENAATAKTIAGAKTMEDLVEIQKTLAQPSVAKTMAVTRTVYETASATQSELNKLVEEQLTEFNKNLLSSLDTVIAQAPASSAAVNAMKSAMESANNAFETASKTSQRIASEIAEATVNAMESSAKTATKSTTRKAS